MGGKSKTLQDIQIVDLMNAHRGFSTQITQISATSNNIQEDLTTSYIDDKNNYLSGEAFEKLGLGTKTSLTIIDTTEAGVKNYVEFHIQDSEYLAQSYDIDKYINIARIKEYIKDNLNATDNFQIFTKTLYKRKEINNPLEALSFDYSQAEYNLTNVIKYVYYDSTNGKYFENTADGKIYFEKIKFSDGKTFFVKDGNIAGIIKKKERTNYFLGKEFYFVPIYELSQENFIFEINNIEIETTDSNGNTITKEYKIKSEEIYTNENNEEYIEFENTDDSNDVIRYIIPEANKMYIAIKYEKNDEIKTDIISRSEIMKEAVNYSYCILFSIKKHGSMVNIDKKLKTGLKRFGLLGSSFDEIKNNQELKDFMISYITKNGESIYDLLAPFYNGENRIETNYGSVIYKGKRNKDTNEVKINASYNGSNFVPTQGLIIPIGLLRDYSMKEFYDEFRKYVRAFAYSEKTVKYKWYQTGFFSFVMKVFAIGMAIFTAGSSLAVVATIGLAIANELLPRDIAIILDIVFITYSFYQSIESKTLTIENELKIANRLSTDIFKLYSNNQIKKYTKQLEEYTKEIKQMKQEISEFEKHTIINPFDDIMYNPDSKFYIAYEFMYNDAYELSTTSQIQGF